MRVSSPSGTVPRVSVVTPNHNGAAWLPGCLEALAAQKYCDHQVMVVDNGSTDGSVPLVRERYPHVQIAVLGRNLGFAAAVNRGISSTRGESTFTARGARRGSPGPGVPRKPDGGVHP
jgi:GT2 family glycosyltransferase